MICTTIDTMIMVSTLAAQTQTWRSSCPPRRAARSSTEDEDDDDGTKDPGDPSSVRGSGQYARLSCAPDELAQPLPLPRRRTVIILLRLRSQSMARHRPRAVRGERHVGGRAGPQGRRVLLELVRGPGFARGGQGGLARRSRPPIRARRGRARAGGSSW